MFVGALVPFHDTGGDPDTGRVHRPPAQAAAISGALVPFHDTGGDPDTGRVHRPPAQAAAISAAIEPFAGDVIVKMLVISAFLRRVTA